MCKCFLNATRGETRTLIGAGWISIYSALPWWFFLLAILISKKISRAELNIWIFTPPSSLHQLAFYSFANECNLKVRGIDNEIKCREGSSSFIELMRPYNCNRVSHKTRTNHNADTSTLLCVKLFRRVLIKGL